MPEPEPDARGLDTAGQLLPKAQLAFRDGVPFSPAFGDVYHRGDGVAESTRVFLALNALPERFAALPARTRFHIGELGFGTGLNVLLAAQCFLRHAPADASLHVTSFEAAPLARADLARLTPQRTAVGELHALWCRIAPPPLRGWHRRWLHPRVHLTLFHGEADDGLAQLCAGDTGGVDAWFLDGFAPDRNPDPWRADTCARIGALCTRGATLATFSAVGALRRALSAAGFSVERVDGQPHKLHYTRARWAGATARSGLRAAPPVRILGAGLAGSALAASLRARGGQVTLVDVAPAPPGGASANPATALQTRLPRRFDDPGVLRLLAYAGAAAWYPMLAPDGWRGGGVLHLALGRDAAWLDDFAAALPELARPVGAAEAAALSGVPVPCGGLLLPDAGAADLPALCRSLRGDTPVLVGDGASELRARTDGLRVVAAPALEAELARLLGRPPRLRAVPGTVTLFAGAAPALPLSGDGYLLPLPQGGYASGGTYDRDPRDDADARNAARATRFGLPRPGEIVGRFKGVRYTAQERLPLLGPADPDGALWTCTGFASSGVTWAHLAAEVVASRLCGEPPPLAAQRMALLGARLSDPVGARGRGGHTLGPDQATTFTP